MSPEALLLGALLGAGAGVVTGLVPGLHPNTVAVVALGSFPLAQGEAALQWVAAVVAMELCHQFVALVPGSFLGAPSPDDALRALPAQELLLEGRASEAVRLAAKGTALGVATGLLLIAPLRLLLGPGGANYDWLRPALPGVLLAIAVVLLGTESARPRWRSALVASPFTEPGQRRVEGTLRARSGPRGDLLRVAPAGIGRARGVWVHDPAGLLAEAAPGEMVAAQGRMGRVAAPGSAAVGVLGAVAVFALAAALGVAVQRVATPSPLGLPGGTPMFPLLGGLFGVPSLLLALRAPAIPEQRDRPDAEPLRDTAAASAIGAACGTLVGLLPGMSSSAASVLALVAAPRRSKEGVLVTLSAAGAGAAVATAAAYVLVGRARSGAMLAVQEMAPPEPWLAGLLPPPLLAVLLLGIASGALVGFLAVRAAGRAAVRVIHRVPYARLSASVLLLLLALVFVFTGSGGLVVLGLAAGVGLLPWRWGLRKGHLMGCTMGPLLLGGW